jgi:Ca2+-binding RTX toxin-like protein
MAMVATGAASLLFVGFGIPVMTAASATAAPLPAADPPLCDGFVATIVGTPGTDTVFSSAAPTGVTVDLTTGLATGGGGTDHLSGFENITGSPFNDTLHRDAGPNVIDGGDGTDVCIGGGGNDTLLHCP